jgi:hypothetical protein
MVVQQELSKLEDVNTRITRIKLLRHMLMYMTRGVDHTYCGYAGTAREEDKRHLVVTAYPAHPSFFTSSGESSMVERQEFYRKMNVSVRVHDDDLELEIAPPAISQSEDPSQKRCGRRRGRIRPPVRRRPGLSGRGRGSRP